MVKIYRVIIAWNWIQDQYDTSSRIKTLHMKLAALIHHNKIEELSVSIGTFLRL